MASTCSVGPAHPVAEAAHELVVEVAVDAADPEVVEEHPLAGDRGQHLHDLVALDEAVEDRREAAEVEGVEAHRQEVAGDPVQLAGQDPDVLGPARDLDVEELLVGHDRRPLAEERADVLERVHVGDRLVEVGVLAELLDAAMEVAEDRVEVDDRLAVELHHHPQDAVGRRVVGPDVDEHLAVVERVELGLALGPRRVRRDRARRRRRCSSSRTRGVVEADAWRWSVVIAGRAYAARPGGRCPPARSGGRGSRSIGRTPPPGRARGVVGQVEVLAEREARVVRRHEDPAQVAVALEDDPEHVVGLALEPLGALPEEGDRRDRGASRGRGRRRSPAASRSGRAPEVVDDLHRRPGVDAGQVGQELEAEGPARRGGPAGRPARPRARSGSRSRRGAGGPGPARTSPNRSSRRRRERSVHVLRRPPGRSGRSARSGQWPRRSLTSCWSFIIP